MRDGWTRERVLLLLPAALLLAAVVAIPIARVIQLGFYRTTLAHGFEQHWVGLDQYLRLWGDGRWRDVLRNTTVFSLASVTIELVLGTAIALVLHRPFRGRGVALALIVLPWLLPTAVMALAWAWIFDDSFGVLNDLVRRLVGLERPVAWLASPPLAMLSMVVADVWKTTPFVTLIVLAGLQSLPEPVLEAARIDGLSRAQRLWRIELPLLGPWLVVAAGFRLAQACAAFDLPYVLTGGGPGGSTETVALYAYQNYFRYLDFGYGSAIAVQAVVLGAAAAVLGARLTRRLRGVP